MTQNHHETSPEKMAFMLELANSTPGTSRAIHKQRILAVLQAGHSLTTAEARRFLDVPSPAPRIHALRHEDGHAIDLTWCRDQTEQGVWHRFGRYSLRSKTGDAT